MRFTELVGTSEFVAIICYCDKRLVSSNAVTYAVLRLVIGFEAVGVRHIFSCEISQEKAAFIVGVTGVPFVFTNIAHLGRTQALTWKDSLLRFVPSLRLRMRSNA